MHVVREAAGRMSTKYPLKVTVAPSKCMGANPVFGDFARKISLLRLLGRIANPVAAQGRTTENATVSVNKPGNRGIVRRSNHTGKSKKPCSGAYSGPECYASNLPMGAKIVILPMGILEAEKKPVSARGGDEKGSSCAQRFGGMHHEEA